jgi:predicted lipid-binding transport protein (Tim44 family)
MKKLLAAMVALTIVFSPVGNIVFQGVQQTEVSAKKYRSGSKSFNPTPSQQQNNNINNQQNNTVNNRTNATTTRNNGGLMRGIMFGGIAGLLFGGLLAGMGGLGPILGMIINILGIVLLFIVISRVITYIKNKNRTREEDQWRR